MGKRPAEVESFVGNMGSRHKMLCSRSWKGGIGWMVFHQIRAQSPLLRPKLYLPYRELQAIAAL